MPTTPRNRERAALERYTEEPNRFGAYRLALGFPNSYEVGMSNLGFQWVHRLFNRVPDLACERFFFEEGEPAATFETGTPLSEFGLLAWSLSWEMDIVNILRTLDAAGIPRRRERRDERHPLLLVGGDIARMNPAALSPFVDVFALGDGERLVPRIAELLQAGLDRAAFLDAAAALPGFFVPGVQGARAEAAAEGRVVVQQPMSRKEIGPAFEVPHTTILTPRTELADKLLIEISRGCTEMCRFCWAAYAMAPVKQYPAASILEAARRARPLTDRVGLIATAVCDHPEIATILAGLAELGYHIALSSIKIDAIDDRILEVLVRQGERALAIAPEAGNEGLRRFINKKVSDAMLDEKARLVFARGFTRLKLYLQVGLPSETDADVADIVGLVARLHEIAVDEGRRLGRVAEIVPSVNAFIPKPHTPYEDEALHDEGELQEKLAFLQRELPKIPNVVFRGMPVGEAVWEAFLARVDESGADILEEAAAGTPVRRLLKTHRDRIAAVVRPGSVRPPASPAPWSFIAKR
ncbi:MAG TPA: radical SAM protein [Thermoanaerobaculia bacterium]|nr:radical SAM protein [Thermoanaerobaculia bacterium]